MKLAELLIGLNLSCRISAEKMLDKAFLLWVTHDIEGKNLYIQSCFIGQNGGKLEHNISSA